MRAKQTLRFLLTISLLGIFLLDCQASSNSEIIKSDGDEFSSTRMPENIRDYDLATEPEDEVFERTARGLPELQPHPQMVPDIPFAMAYPNAVPSLANPAALSPMPITYLPMGTEPYHTIGNHLGYFIGSIIGDVRTLMRHAEVIFLNLNHQLSLGTQLSGGITGYATTQTRMKQFLEIASKMLGLLKKEPFHLLAIPKIVKSTAPAKLIVGTLQHLLGVIGKLFVFIEDRLAYHTQMGNLDVIKALGKHLMSIDVSGFTFLDDFLRTSGSPVLAPLSPASCAQPPWNSAIPTDAAIDGGAEVASSIAFSAINEVRKIPYQLGDVVRSFQSLLTTLGIVPSIVYQFLVLVRSVLGTNTFAAGILDNPVVRYLHELNSGPDALLLAELAAIAGSSMYGPPSVPIFDVPATAAGKPALGPQQPLPGPSYQPGASMPGPSSSYPYNAGALAPGGGYPSHGQQTPLGRSLYNPGEVSGSSFSNLPYSPSLLDGLYGNTGPGYPQADPSYAGLYDSYGNIIESNKASGGPALSIRPLTSGNSGSAPCPHNQYPRSLECPGGSCSSDSPAPDNELVSIPVHNSGLTGDGNQDHRQHDPPLNEYPYPGHPQLPTHSHPASIPPNVGGFDDPGRINDPGPSSIIDPFVDELSLANYILLTLPTEKIQSAFPTATISPGDLISIDLGDLSLVGRLTQDARSIDLKMLTVPLRLLKANLEPGTSSWEIRCENFNDGVCREVFHALHDNL